MKVKTKASETRSTLSIKNEAEAVRVINQLNGVDPLTAFSENQFCNTGKHGGINPHCGKHGGGPVGRSGGTVGGGGSRQMRSTLGGSTIGASVGGILGHKTKSKSEDPGNQRLKSVFLGRSRGKSAKSDIGRGRSNDFRSFDAKGRTEGGKAARTGSVAGAKGRGAAKSGGKVSTKGRKKHEGSDEEFYVTKSGKLKSRRRK